MDRERLKDELRRHALEMADEIGEKMPGSLRKFGEVERSLKQATEELHARVLQSWCAVARDDSPGPRCPHCGRKMRQKEQRGKQVICHGGDVVVKRKRWWCEECGASFFPSGRESDGGRSGHQP
jgi:NADH pyrophosphatase NudC (nudix superfamily)